MEKRGLFVTLEGVEGSGKSTQLGELERYFQNKRRSVFTTREPGGTGLGNDLRAILLRSRTEPIEPKTELLLMEAARVQHVETVLKPALQKNELVICDRYTDATYAYQGSGRGIDKKRIEDLNRWASDGVEPDLTFIFDIPLQTALDRALSRTSPEDRFEREKIEFHERVREGYLELARKFPARVKVIDAMTTREKLTEVLVRQISERLEKRS